MTLRMRRTPTSVLVVETEIAATEHVSALLTLMRFDNVWRAGSVRQALRYCQVTPFDVAIIQLALGDEDGEHLVAALRAWPGSVDQIVAVCMNEARLSDAAEKKLPADAFLQMPLTWTALRKVIGHKVRPAQSSIDDDDWFLASND